MAAVGTIELHLPQDLLIGGGTSDDLAEHVASIGIERPLVVSDRFLLDKGPAGPLVERLEAGDATVAVFGDVQPDPTLANVEGALQALRDHEADGVVAIGGGSPMDTAKAAAVAFANEGDVRDYAGYHQIPGPGLPLVAVPTTAGTGSEVTPWATVWDTRSGQKYSLSRPGLFPEHALIDPLLMVEKPRELTVSTGLDALSHALESLWNVNSNPVSASHAVAAAREILDALPRLVADLRNVALRTRMAKAALFAGLAFSNTQTAIAHSISYPFTLHYRVPHGIACSFTLPAVMRSVIGCGGLCEASLRSIFGDDLHAGARQLERMIEDLGVATQAGGYGVDPDTWAKMIDDAFGGERGRNFIGSRAQLLAALRQPSPASAAAAG
jgi:phosphonate metabolism-associated iron-containing alcohol dehydrogenase